MVIFMAWEERKAPFCLESNPNSVHCVFVYTYTQGISLVCVTGSQRSEKGKESDLSLFGVNLK